MKRDLVLAVDVGLTTACTVGVALGNHHIVER
jgi:hypothetical protein